MERGRFVGEVVERRDEGTIELGVAKDQFCWMEWTRADGEVGVED